MSVLKQLVFTPRCSICGQLGVEFCISCVEKVKPFRARDLVEIDLCFCAGEYSDWLRDSIICYKNGEAKYTALLSHLLRNALESSIKSKNLTLIPIPSSPQKVRERGFDAMANLCTNVIKGSESATMDASNLFLRRAVLDQVGLTAMQRQENLSGAFGVRRVVNGTVVIVDDVITTGATLNSAAKVLKHAGAQRVLALALCGTPKTR
jgi:ComF family protein